MMEKEREIDYNGIYTLYYTLDGISVKLWSVHDMHGNDISSIVDHYDWIHFQEWIASELAGTFCYFGEC